MAASVPLVVMVLWSLISKVNTQDASVYYSIREELPADSYVCSVALESGLFTNISTEKFNRLQFQISKEMTNDASYFKIETNSGLLFIDKVIDRENFEDCYLECVLEFNVVVYDLDISDLTKFINVQIEIEDFNDNAPEFLPVRNPIQVLESVEPGSVIATGLAVDYDRGKGNSVQTYILLPETDTFNLTITENMEFQIHLKSALDRESKSFYQVVVLAKDGGDIPLTGSVTLNIEVTDDNDNFPMFSEQQYNVSVQENVASETVILKLSAVDKDASDNGKVSYKFSYRASKRITDLFQINSTSGELVTVGNIDYEADKDFSFQVIAHDHGSPAKSSTASVVISVMDVNDNSPIININQLSGGTVLSEYAEIGTFVTHVEIMDHDSGKNGKVVCSILDNNFKLETMGLANNYKVVLNNTLDHDSKPYHNVTILCQDLGNLPRQTFANFIVHVEDKNDNAPDFTATLYTVSIVENNDKGASIIRVSATDKDSGVNGQVHYSLHIESQELFVINSFTGIITANVSLDRETHGDESIFRVFATDKGDPAQTSTGTVVINILDLNDNDPIFSSDPFNLSVSENQKIGSVVGNISASDPDAGLNGTFHLKFPEDPDVLEYFEFDESGIITTKKELDREAKAFHEFYVHAADMGGRTSSALVRVSVKDLNDNAPEIIYPNEYSDTVSIPYTLEENTEVIQITARDYDVGENSRLYFFMDSNNASYIFNIDTHTGKMFLNKSLHEKDIGRSFSFNIRVKDGGEPSFETYVNFYIQVTDGETAEPLASAATQLNLWIVIGIILFTAIVSVIIIIVIVKICWCNRLKGASGSTSDIIMESNEVDPKFINSLSSSSESTSSKDSNFNEKCKDGSLQIQDGYSKNFFTNLDETGYLTNSSLTSVDNQLYIEQVKKFGYELEKKIDETNSDNSGEIGTRDSGQGGSDVDINSLTELPVLDVQESSVDSQLPSPRTEHHNNFLNESVQKYNVYNDKLSSFSGHGFHDNSSNISDNSFMPQTVASFSNNPTKTAEKREIAKLRKSQKRVMFSDDLENSHSSERSSTLSTHSTSDVSNIKESRVPQRKFHRMFSEDLTDSTSQINRANDWLRRSADNFARRPNNDKVYNQLPSNQIKFGGGVVNGNGPMGSNMKTYLDKVMQKTKLSSSSDNYSPKSSESDKVYSIDNLMSDSSFRENDSITTSGTYDVINGETRLNLASPVFSEDIEI